MSEISIPAAVMLAELARDHGVDSLAFNADGVIPMTIGELQIALAFSPANDCFYLFALVTEAPDWDQLNPLALFETSGEMAARRTRLAVEPEGKGLALVREISLNGLVYWQLVQALDEFLADHATAAALCASGKPEGGTLFMFATPSVIRV
jgi:hypothetical protein